jgi:hypothetical protein
MKSRSDSPGFWVHACRSQEFPRCTYVPRKFPTNVRTRSLLYGPPWAHYLSGYQDRLLGGPLGLPDLRCTTPDGVKHKDYRGEVLGLEAVHVPHCMEDS